MGVQVPLSAPYQKPLYQFDTAAFIVLGQMPVGFHSVWLPFRLRRNLCQVDVMFSGQELLSDTSGLLGVALVSNVVAVENATRAVAGDLHNYRLGDACPA